MKFKIYVDETRAFRHTFVVFVQKTSIFAGNYGSRF